MTDFLYAKPNFIDGIMSVVDLFSINPEYNFSTSAFETDYKSHQADLKAMKSDMEKAYKKVIVCQTK